jgi:hypothetical protein
LAYKRKTNSPAAGEGTRREDIRQNNQTRHTRHLFSHSPTTSSATPPGTWRPRFLSRLACSRPTTGTPGAEQYSASSTPLLDVRPLAGTRINLVFLIAWHRPLRDRPWRLLLVSVRTTFRTDTLEEDYEARQESRHALNMTPNDPRTEASMCKSSGTQPEDNEACIARIQALTVKETTSKAHMQVHTNKELCKKQPGRNTGPNRPGPVGPVGSTQGPVGPVRDALCPRCLSIYCLRRRRPPHRTNHSTDAIHQKITTTR